MHHFHLQEPNQSQDFPDTETGLVAVGVAAAGTGLVLRRKFGARRTGLALSGLGLLALGLAGKRIVSRQVGKLHAGAESTAERTGTEDRERAPETRGRTIHWASRYDTVTGLLALGRERRIREMTVALAQVKPGDKVLDVGSGTGTLTIAAKTWAGPEGDVHGLDAAPEMIDVARRKAVQAGAEVGFQVGLIEDIPFSDDQFDVVLSSLMLHHLPGALKRQGFAEMHRILKPGGRLLAVDFDPPTNRLIGALATLLIGHGMMRSDFQELAAMAKEAGLVEVQTGRTQFGVLSFVSGEKPLL